MEIAPARDSAEAAFTRHVVAEAQYLVHMYAEIIATDERILQGVSQLLTSGDADAEDALRLLLSELAKVGERVSYWNARVEAFLGDKLKETFP